jgi:hypothetical protein
VTATVNRRMVTEAEIRELYTPHGRTATNDSSVAYAIDPYVSTIRNDLESDRVL